MIAERMRKPRRLLAVLLLALALFTACSSKTGKNQKDIWKDFELGQKYLTEQNYSEAVTPLTEVINRDPENVAAYIGRAQAYMGLGQYDDAKADYTAVIEKASEQPDLQMAAYMSRADIWMRTGNDAAAKADYAQALDALKRAYPDNADPELLEYLTQVSADSGTAGTGTVVNRDTADTSRFQQIMDAIEVPSAYASCKRYVLVNDYDADGRQEAFGYFGFPEKDSDGLYWDQLYIYYISSDGQVTKVYDPTEEPEEWSRLCGRPVEISGDDPTDFSACYITNGGQVFAMLEMKEMEEETAHFFNVLTVLDGRPVMLGAPADLHQGAGKFFVGGGVYDGLDCVYAIRNGDLEEIGEVACDAMENAFDDQNTPEVAWKKYENSIRQRLEKTEHYAPRTLSSRVIAGDYDGDGKQEAYAVLEEPEGATGTSEVRFYYISSEGYIVYLSTVYLNLDSRPYGYLRDDPLLSAGTQKFLMWELDANGSGSTTLLLGVKNGLPYQPEASGCYEMFRQNGSGYLGTTSDFSKGYHDYVDKDLTFDAASGEFRVK